MRDTELQTRGQPLLSKNDGMETTRALTWRVLFQNVSNKLHDDHSGLLEEIGSPSDLRKCMPDDFKKKVEEKLEGKPTALRGVLQLAYDMYVTGHTWGDKVFEEVDSGTEVRDKLRAFSSCEIENKPLTLRTFKEAVSEFEDNVSSDAKFEEFASAIVQVHEQCLHSYKREADYWERKVLKCLALAAFLHSRSHEQRIVELPRKLRLKWYQKEVVKEQLEKYWTEYEEDPDMRSNMMHTKMKKFSQGHKSIATNAYNRYGASKATDVAVMMHVLRMFFFIFFFACSFAVMAGYIVQVFFLILANPYMRLHMGFMIYLVQPFILIALCVILHESCVLMRDSFTSPDMCRFRATLLVVCCKSLRDEKKIHNHHLPEEMKVWCQRIDFWLLLGLPFCLLACIFSIFFDMAFQNYLCLLGIVLAVIVCGLLWVTIDRFHEDQYERFSRQCFAGVVAESVCLVFLHIMTVANVSLLGIFFLAAMFWTACTVFFGIYLEASLSEESLPDAFDDDVNSAEPIKTGRHMMQWVDIITRLIRRNQISAGTMANEDIFGPVVAELSLKRKSLVRRSLTLDPLADPPGEGITGNLACKEKVVQKRLLLYYFLWLLWLLGFAVFCSGLHSVSILFMFPLLLFSPKCLRILFFLDGCSAYRFFMSSFCVLGLLLLILLQYADLKSTRPNGPASMYLGSGSSTVGQTPYFACQSTWGSKGTGPTGMGLSVLDLAALSKYAQAINASEYNELLDASFGPIASILHFGDYPQFDDYRDLPRVVGTRFRSGIEGGNDTIVLAIRGTKYASDVLADFSMFSMIAALQMMQLEYMIPQTIVRHMIWFANWAKREESGFRERLKLIALNVSSHFPNATLLFTGHSLGGSFAAQAAAGLHKQAVVFSAPGQHFSRMRFQHTKEETYRSVLNIVPDHDPVPRVDDQDATVQRVLCQDNNGRAPFTRRLQCHLLRLTFCELWRVCGDAAGRNFSTECDRIGGFDYGRHRFAYIDT